MGIQEAQEQKDLLDAQLKPAEGVRVAGCKVRFGIISLFMGEVVDALKKHDKSVKALEKKEK